MTPAAILPAKPAPFPKEVVKQAVAEGKALTKDGKTKVEVATAMYQKLRVPGAI